MRKFGVLFLVALSFVTSDNSAFAQSASEVHAVGLYQGATPRSAAYRAAVHRHQKACDKSPSTCDWGGGLDKIQRRFPFQATVKVSRVGVPITLVLSAYSRTEWHVKLAKGVVLKDIIMSGYNKQLLTASKDIARVPVTKSFYGSPSTEDGSYFYFSGDDREKPVSMVSYADDTPRCEEPADPSVSVPHTSHFQGALDYFAKAGIAPTSVQGAYELGKIEIDNRTRGNLLSKERDIGFCYRNADGSLSEGRGTR